MVVCCYYLTENLQKRHYNDQLLKIIQRNSAVNNKFVKTILDRFWQDVDSTHDGVLRPYNL